MKQAVITGAADGIGKALAGRFAKAGYAITGLDIDDKRAQQTQTELEHTGAEVSFIIADLASETEIDLMLAKLETRPPIDIFIHNAGINTVGRFADSRLSEQKRVIQVNMLAPMLLTAGLLRQKKFCPIVRWCLSPHSPIMPVIRGPQFMQPPKMDWLPMPAACRFHWPARTFTY